MGRSLFIIGMIMSIVLAGCVSTKPQDTATANKNAAKAETETPSPTDTVKTEPQAGPKTYIAIMDFSILAGEEGLKGLSAEIPQTLTRVFMSGGKLRPVERIDLEKVMEELELSISDLADQATALKLGKLLGAKFVLMGSLTKVADQVKIACRVIATETTEIVYTDLVRGKFADLFDLEESLAAKIEENLKL